MGATHPLLLLFRTLAGIRGFLTLCLYVQTLISQQAIRLILSLATLNGWRRLFGAVRKHLLLRYYRRGARTPPQRSQRAAIPLLPLRHQRGRRSRRAVFFDHRLAAFHLPQRLFRSVRANTNPANNYKPCRRPPTAAPRGPELRRCAMAFLSGNGMRPNSSGGAGGTVPNGILDQQSSSQDLRSLQQQLLAAMQAQQASASGGSNGAPSTAASQAQPGSTSANAAMNLYQQLLQQQAASQQGLSLSAQAPASNAVAGLPHQLAAALQQQQVAQNPLSNSLQQQLAGALQANPSQGGALSSLIASNPSLLQTLLLQQSNGAGSAAPANPLSALAAQLLMPQQAAIQQQQQQLLNLLMLLQQNQQQPQNPLQQLAYQTYLQQLQPAPATPPQQPAPSAPSQSLQQLAHLMGGSGNNYSPQCTCAFSDSKMISMILVTQLAAALSGQQNQLGGAGSSLNQTDEHKAFVEELLRRDQQQHSANAAAAATANGTHHHSSRLTSRDSTNSLLGGASTSFTPTNDALSNHREHSVAKPADPSVATTSASATSTSIPSTGPSTSFTMASRQASSDRLLTSAESVQDHISRLISENEAIVEPNPVLLKRRPYHRQSTSNSLASQSSDAPGTSSQRGSPGLRSPGLPSSRAPTTRSQSLHESSMLSALRMGMGGGSLTSGQPIIRNPYQSSLTCNFCMLKFPNEAGLEAHEFRCSKKEQLQKQHSQPQLQIPSSLSNAPTHSQAQQLLQLQQQQKLLAQHQSNISALVGAGAGVAPDAIINGAGNSGRSSVPADSHSSLHGDLHLSPPPQLAQAAAPTSTASPAPQNVPDNRHPLKKRLLDAVAREAENASVEPVSDPKVPKVEMRNDLTSGNASFRLPHSMSDHIPRPTLDLKPQDLLPHSWAQSQLASSSAAALQEQQRQEAEAIANLALLKQLASTPQQQELLAAALEKTRRELSQAQASANAAANPSIVSNISTTSSTSSQNLSAPASACPKGMKEAIMVAVSYCANKISSKMPYFLTLSEQIAEQLPDDEAPIGATSYRNRMRNITSDTFVCLNRPQPMFVEQNGTISMYSNWKQVPAPLNEEAMLKAYLGACSTKPRIGVKDYGRYTVATHRDGIQLRSTHSSFWVNRKHRMRNTTVVEASGYAAPPSTINQFAAAAFVQQQANDDCGEAEHAYVLPEPQAQTSHTPDYDVTMDESATERAVPVDSPRPKPTTSPAARLPIDEQKPKPDVNTVIGAKIRSPASKVTNIGKIKPMGERTEELNVYVRGRGRGRYVCERCGIRCKKPSMLKKHLKSHTNIRPFTCITCNFSFKTKGNLTKHLFSKAHRRRLAEKKGVPPDAEDERSQSALSDRSEEGRLMVDIEEENDDRGRASILRTPIDADDPTIMKMSILECKFVNDEFENQHDDDYGSDNDDDEIPNEQPPPCSMSITYRRFGQENVLTERSTHTPPTLWTLCHEDISTLWPKPDLERNCNSAPPVAQCSPVPSRKDRKVSTKSTDEAAAIPVLPSLQISPSENLSTLPGDAFSDTFRVQHQFLASDISPPSSADLSSNANGLLANFIPLSKPKYGSASMNDTTTSITLTASGVVPVGGIFDADTFRQAAASAFSCLAQQFPSTSSDAAQNSQDIFLEPLQRSRARTNPAHAMFEPKSTDSNQQSKLEGTSVEAFLANETQEFFCDMCERKFRKESELLLHKQTHLIERQQNARSRTYQCHECRTTLRSKALLAKHIETVHSSASPSTPVKETIDDKASLPVLSASPSSGPAMAAGGRSFMCTDCNLGFRTHGVLAKHLRSKNHVKMLANTGKLPDDALSLIKEHAAVLASVDATDCESARQSLWNLLSDLRQGPNPGKSPSVGASPSPGSLSTGGHTSSLECREQLGSQSPGPQTPNSVHKIGFSVLNHQAQPRPSSQSMTSGYQKSVTPLPHGMKRKNSERPSPGEFSPAVRRRCDSAATTRPMSATTVSIPQQFSIGSPQQRNMQTASSFAAATRGRVASDSIKDVGHHMQIVNNGEHPLHSLATVAAAAANVNGLTISSGSHTKNIVANVWIPPRLDQIENERKSATPDAGPNGISSVTRLLLDAAAASDGGLSSRSTEETSESTGRSESSTPVQRGLNGIAPSPMPASTRCPFCDITYDSATELQIHFHTEHIVMRDGKDYRCPRKHCEKVYPNRESLRAHFAAHFLGGGATPMFDGREEPGVAVSPSERESSPALRKTTQQIQAAMAPSAPNHSPGAPEETHTVTEGSSKSFDLNQSGDSSQSNASPKQEFSPSPQNDQKSQQWTPPPITLRCDFCGDTFNDPSQLQKHWISHMSAQLRPYVCPECDAGFTTADALASHSATHRQQQA
ncbi:Zinc fingerC2H2 type family protein [Aphelenchoides avenae]|nr:Zinc fingerC2H2 type family protein [Aphelenchus avenae]